jgi:glycosyltransferase involved in cell wall biosynthesis
VFRRVLPLTQVSPLDRTVATVPHPMVALGLVGLLGLTVLDRFGRLALVGGVQFTVHQAAVVLAFCWVGWAAVTRRLRLRRLIFAPWAALLLIAAALAVPAAPSVRTALVQSVSLAAAVGLGCLVGWTCGSRDRIRSVLVGVFVLCGALSILALLEATGVFAMQSGAVYWAGTVRARVTLHDPNVLGGLLAASAAAAVPLALLTRGRASAIGLWAVAALCAAGAVATQSRGALAGLVVALVLCGVASPVPRRKKLTFAMVAVLGAVAGLAVLGPDWFAQRVAGIATDPNFTNRMDLIGNGLRLFPARPFGVGAGNWRLAYEQAFGPVAVGAVESHMTLVTVLVEDGIVGLVGIVGVAASVLVGALRKRPGAMAPETLAAACGLVVLLLQSVTYSMEASEPLWFFLGLCAAAVVADRARWREERDTPPKVCIVQYNSSRFLMRVDRAARALAGAGAEVVLIAIKDASTESLEQRDGYVVRRVPLVSRRWPAWTRPVRWIEALVRTWAAAVRERADVYDARDIYPLFVAWRAARANDAFFVYDSDELNLYRNWPWVSTRWWGVLAKVYEGFFVRRADSVITSDPGRARILKDLYGVDALVVRNVADVVEKVQPDLAFREQALKGRKRLLLYTGGMVPNRGLEQLVEALGLLPDCALAMVGSGHLEEGLRRLIQQLDLGARAEVYSAVPLEKLLRLTAAADASVMPIVGSCLSYVHAVPQKLYEAMMVGVPVVASDLPDMADVVRSEGIGTLIADPSDPASIADAVLRLFALGEDEMAAMRARGRAAALGHLNWTIERELLVGEYRRLGVLGPAEVGA